MAERLWMPIYWGDYFRDTMHLSAEESGAYLHLIGAYWVSGAPLREDSAGLCRMAKVAPQRWSRVWRVISKFFDRVPLGEAELTNSVLASYDDIRKSTYGAFCLIHKRVEKELLKTNVRSASASANAKQRARAYHNHNNIKKESSLRSESSNRVPPTPFDDIWKLQGLQGQKRGKGVAAKAWPSACKRAPPEDIIAAFKAQQACWERYGYDVQYIPHLATWLNQDRWQDDLPRPKPNGEGHSHDRHRRPSAVQELWREYAGDQPFTVGESDDQSLVAYYPPSRGRG